MIGIRQDYSWSECVLSFWATLTLTVLAVTSLLLRYLTNPISCFLPAHFTSSYVDYALQYCFHTNYIYSPDAIDHQGSPNDWPSRFTYHQWLPFFLGVAATLCLLPHVTWRMLSSFLWLDVHELARTLANNQQQNAAARHVMLRDSTLLLQAGLKGGNSVLAKAAMGRKALGCVVCCIQMLLMLLVFSPQLDRQADASEGFVANVNDSLPLPLNPFVCSFTIRQMARDSNYQVLCFMPLAQVYTKGLVFLVYFFLVLFVLCALDLTLCIMRLAVPRLKDMTLQRFLSMASQSGRQAEGPGPAHMTDFLQSLGLDGRWLVAVVGERCGTIAAADLTTNLWQVFKDSPHPGHATSARVTSLPESCGGPQKSDEFGGDAGAVPMITIRDKDGDTAAQQEEKGKIC